MNRFSDSSEPSLAQAARDNWACYWDQQSSPLACMPTAGFKGKIKQFLRRGSGLELEWRIIRREIGNPVGHQILEAGCGSGKNALRLAHSGARAVMLDTSRSAVYNARQAAERLGLDARSIHASVFHLPFPDESFDFVFNIGVLDHFGPEYRNQALSEMLRVTCNGGRVVVLTNDRRSWIHPWAMRHALKKGRWRFGFKAALSTLQDMPELRDRPLREYSRGFISQIEFLRYCCDEHSLLLRMFYWIYYGFSCLLSFLNRLPGQFRVTIIGKNRL
jgi:ubiquinone/menaquinone biosynthesis C-methylase UbiE